MESDEITVREFQAVIKEMFGHKDASRGVEGTFMWFMEEVGELASALRKGDEASAELELEFADTFAWLATLANLAGVDLQAAIEKKYCAGCPRCHSRVCECAIENKP